MNKEEIYLKFYIDSNANIDELNKFIKKENIRLDEYNDIVTKYLKKLKKDAEEDKNLNKLYLEYCLKYGNNIKENKSVSKRKVTQSMINIINNYIKENKHNIKEYITNNNIEYSEFKNFINNYKSYYLTNLEKDILKTFFRRENEFNQNNIEIVKKVLDKISDDLVNDKPYNILEYYKELGWESNFLIYYLKNNKDVFSDFIIDNVILYLKKYHIDSKNYKLKEFIDYIKKKDQEIDKVLIETVISYMNENKFPYNYYLFKEIKKIKFNNFE